MLAVYQELFDGICMLRNFYLIVIIEYESIWYNLASIKVYTSSGYLAKLSAIMIELF